MAKKRKDKTKNRKNKLSPEVLQRELDAGLSCSAIARKYGVAVSTVTRSLRRLQLVAAATLVSPIPTEPTEATKKAQKVVAEQINSVEQLQKINQAVNRQLDAIEREIRTGKINKIEGRELLFKASKEIRAQLKLQLDIMSKLFDMQYVAEFQKIVIETIGEVAPDVRDEIIRRLEAVQSMRGIAARAISGNQG